MNAVSISGLDFPTENFVKKTMIENGAIGYDSISGKWARICFEGIDEIGNPRTLTFILMNGKTFHRQASWVPDADGAFLIKALPTGLAFSAVIDRSTAFIDVCDNAIIQNIKACQTPYIVVAKDKDTLLSVQQAIDQKQSGAPVLVVSPDLGDALKSVDVAVDYVADKFIEAREEERNHLFNKLGIMSANVDKKERVQVGEVNATVGQCEDYLYLWIDTFNKQMTTYGLPFSMTINASLEELYDNDDSDDTADEKGAEEKTNEVQNER